MGLVAGGATITDPPPAVAAREGVKDALDSSQDRSENDFPPALPTPQHLPEPSAMHDAVRDPGLRQSLSARLAIGGLIGEHRPLNRRGSALERHASFARQHSLA